MSELPLEIIEQLVDACKAGAGDAGSSLSSALDNTMQIVDVVGGNPIDGGALPEELVGPGLGIVFHIGDVGLALLLPETTNLLPPWYAEPDPTCESKLQTLAQELSMLLLPDNLEVGRFAAGAVDHLGDAMQSAQIADPLACIQLSMQGDDGSGMFYLCWPLKQPEALLSKAGPSAPPPATTANALAAAIPHASHAPAHPYHPRRASRRTRTASRYLAPVSLPDGARSRWAPL